ncbi:hypothetical protein JCM11251_006412 [Rhodosporidiobolus azoricus]
MMESDPSLSADTTLADFLLRARIGAASGERLRDLCNITRSKSLACVYATMISRRRIYRAGPCRARLLWDFDRAWALGRGARVVMQLDEPGDGAFEPALLLTQVEKEFHDLIGEMIGPDLWSMTLLQIWLLTQDSDYGWLFNKLYRFNVTLHKGCVLAYTSFHSV